MISEKQKEIIDFVDNRRKKLGVSVYKMSMLICKDQNSYYRFRTLEHQKVKTLIDMCDALGIEIILKEKENFNLDKINKIKTRALCKYSKILWENSQKVLEFMKTNTDKSLCGACRELFPGTAFHSVYMQARLFRCLTEQDKEMCLKEKWTMTRVQGKVYGTEEKGE